MHARETEDGSGGGKSTLRGKSGTREKTKMGPGDQRPSVGVRSHHQHKKREVTHGQKRRVVTRGGA